MDKYLNEDAITAEIMSYVKNRIYNYAVLIDGDWGTGKTYFIQKSIIPTLEGSGYMPIYISLYGVNSTDTVSQKIALSILTNKLPSDKRTVAKQCLPAIGSFVLPIGQTLLNATGISILEPLFKSPVEDIPWDTIFKKFNDSRKRIFIFDDLERCSLPINEILGYINSLVEHESEKVLIVANQQAIGKMSLRNDLEAKYQVVLNPQLHLTEKVRDPSQPYYTLQNNLVDQHMRRMALCAASMLLLGCLAGCSTTPQNSQEQGNPVIKEEISQPLGGSEALGNSEDSSALSAADKEKMFAPYEQYGMTYDAVKDELTYNGNLVRWFEDYYPISNNETAGIDFLNENGTVDVYAVRDLESFSKAADGSVDPAGKLIGLKEFTQQEFDARDIEALKNSTSVAMAGTPLEDSETAKLVAEYETFGVTYDAEKDQWYFNGEEVRYFRDVLTSNGESLTSGKFRGEMRTLGSGVGTIDIYTVRDYGHLNSEHHGTLTGIEKYSQEEFDEHTQAGMSGNQPIGNASHN